MATPTGALPSTTPFMLGGDDKAKSEYFDAIQVVNVRRSNILV